MNSRTPRVLILADFSASVGGGHAMRCLSLGRALAHAGAVVAMAAPAGMRAALAPFWPDGVEPVGTGDLLADGPGAVRDWGAHIVVLDHYGADSGFERRLGQAGAAVAAIDDLPSRPHDCEMLIDPSFGAEPQDAAARAPGAILLQGPEFALLRPDFATARPDALARRLGPMQNVLLSIGLTDVGGLTGRLAPLILDRIGERALDVVIGAAAPSRADLAALAAADSRLNLHIDATGMAALMTKADLAIGAGGSSVWERACLGLPSLSLVLAPNQAPMAQLMQARGLCLTADVHAPDFDGAFGGALDRLLTDGGLRAAFSAGTALLCDGLGAERVARTLLERLP